MKQAKLLFLLIATLAFASCKPSARQTVTDAEQPTYASSSLTNTWRKPTSSYGGHRNP